MRLKIRRTSEEKNKVMPRLGDETVVIPQDLIKMALTGETSIFDRSWFFTSFVYFPPLISRADTSHRVPTFLDSIKLYCVKKVVHVWTRTGWNMSNNKKMNTV